MKRFILRVYLEGGGFKTWTCEVPSVFDAIAQALYRYGENVRGVSAIRAPDQPPTGP